MLGSPELNLECWDSGMKARSDRVKNGACGGGGESVSREGASVGWNDKDSPGITRGQQNAGQLAHSCLVFQTAETYVCVIHDQVFVCEKDGELKGPENVL